ncbi:MAG: lipopolysaccharide biosynthesis protein [Solirubrobacteraceae bacterium]
MDSRPERRLGALAALRTRVQPRLSRLRRSETAKAGGLALAMILNNIIALGATVLFARELTDYGSLGALISYLLILTVVGQAMQVATAREGVLGHLGVGPALLDTVRGWTRTLMIATAGLTVVSILLRDPIAQAVGVHRYPWAAALGVPAGCLYLELSLLRGGLQGVGNYRAVGMSLVGEQGVRLITGALLALGMGVTGAYLASILSYIAMSIYCLAKLRVHAATHPRREPTATAGVSLLQHIRRAWAPIAGLAVIAVLQNIDIIAAKHRFSSATATSYAATAVAAKVMIWVAVGGAFYLVPEAARLRAAGQDARPLLARVLAIVVVCSIPCLLIFAFGAHALLSAVFGPKKATASDSLLVLGLAFTVLACTYLAIQYMLALKRTRFLVAIGVVAAAEPILLLQASRHPSGFAGVVLAVQAVGAVVAFALALRREKAPPGPPAAESTLEDAAQSPTVAEVV